VTENGEGSEVSTRRQSNRNAKSNRKVIGQNGCNEEIGVNISQVSSREEASKLQQTIPQLLLKVLPPSHSTISTVFSLSMIPSLVLYSASANNLVSV
jgi:hypothetical protein